CLSAAKYASCMASSTSSPVRSTERSARYSRWLWRLTRSSKAERSPSLTRPTRRASLSWASFSSTSLAAADTWTSPDMIFMMILLGDWLQGFEVLDQVGRLGGRQPQRLFAVVHGDHVVQRGGRAVVEVGGVLGDARQGRGAVLLGRAARGVAGLAVRLGLADHLAGVVERRVGVGEERAAVAGGALALPLEHHLAARGGGGVEGARGGRRQRVLVGLQVGELVTDQIVGAVGDADAGARLGERAVAAHLRDSHVAVPVLEVGAVARHRVAVNAVEAVGGR